MGLPFPYYSPETHSLLRGSCFTSSLLFSSLVDAPVDAPVDAFPRYLAILLFFKALFLELSPLCRSKLVTITRSGLLWNCSHPTNSQACPNPFCPHTASTSASTTPSTTPSTVIESVQRSEEHTSELQSLMRITYAVF